MSNASWTSWPCRCPGILRRKILDDTGHPEVRNFRILQVKFISNQMKVAWATPKMIDYDRLIEGISLVWSTLPWNMDPVVTQSSSNPWGSTPCCMISHILWNETWRPWSEYSTHLGFRGVKTGSTDVINRRINHMGGPRNSMLSSMWPR